MGDDRPFVCSALGCGQRFTNEDHLAVHKHKHEMTLKFGPARTDSVIIADQTPTPTRFLKNCEEVGLFNELASSFEHEFKKVSEDEEEKKSTGPLDMSLPSTPDVKIKKEVPVEVDSSPPDSPLSSPKSPKAEEKAIPMKPTLSSTPTPTIVRPGSLPLHLGYDPLPPTLPSPTSVITQAPPSNRQLGSPTGSFPLVMHLANGQAVPILPGPHVQMPSVISLARPVSMVPNIPGIPGPPLISSSGGHISPSGLPMHSEAKMRLKATLTQQVPSALNGSMVMASASTMVTSRPEQGQILIQHPDAPSPAQPQVSPAQPTPSTGGRRRRAAEEDPDERRQRFLERNRAAASRCRQKRKVWVSSLEKKAEELTSQNVQLSNEVTLLRNEVAQLKQLLLAHKDCPVTALQKKTQGYLESPKESSEPTGSPAPVIQHSSVTVTSNGLSVRSAAEAVATSVLTQMANQRTELSLPVQSHVIISPQSQSAGR
ncbi:cyclic AMP-dependent transcription factor ATF-7 [Microcaecilia unicolor]|uniref:Cyclic AMP-dependent transcription factor ATF-7 n=1 Tax=Microcaecilia unicolor TaxID=1415580 RepID=A0A6P7XM00_9AMPH|nr:cyclic AMP-dependent transcription factor ATF-7 [Microcaecilia unicolor]XP_030054210.1 cyclic AMP-dependent transcription factor ATF-7 [Microcaecilia unicolor]XP_030054211.1 cyclic AMP-dependent transcription factor ATF-7 [Microcaecilia unicolor]